MEDYRAKQRQAFLSRTAGQQGSGSTLNVSSSVPVITASNELRQSTFSITTAGKKESDTRTNDTQLLNTSTVSSASSSLVTTLPLSNIYGLCPPAAGIEFPDTSNDALIAQKLAEELEREDMEAREAAAASRTAADDVQVDPASAAIIAQLLESELDTLDEEGNPSSLRPPDSSFQEQLISSDLTAGGFIQPRGSGTDTTGGLFPWSTPSIPSAPSTFQQRSTSVEDITGIPFDADDDELARRLQEEEFLRDSPQMNTSRASRF